jgi:hypothetical protein
LLGALPEDSRTQPHTCRALVVGAGGLECVLCQLQVLAERWQLFPGLIPDAPVAAQLHLVLRLVDVLHVVVLKTAG